MDHKIRDAAADDLEAINEIYNECVLNTTATFHDQPVTSAQRLAWWRELRGKYAVLVAESNGEILGWANLGPYQGRCAYRFTLESSVYLRPDARGRGLGTAIMTALLSRAAATDCHSVLAVISAESTDSLRLHERVGFREVARLKEVGYKFGRWIDVVFTQRML